MPVTFPLPTATDNCSTPTVVTNPVSGAAFNVGATTVNVTATDVAGTTATSSFTVTVSYNFAGFFSPVNNPPTVNGANAGQAISVRFSLSGDKGLNIFAPGYAISVPIGCMSGTPTTPIEETEALAAAV
jgi:HYR domain